MTLVDELFVGEEFATQVWVSDEAAESLLDELNGPNGHSYKKFLKKVKYWAEAGFLKFEGKKRPISPEWDGVFRIGMKDSLFRLLGFYGAVGADPKGSFIAIEGRLKGGQGLSGPDRGAIDRVAKIRRTRAWRRKADADRR